jgi:organic radical activating enzyme
MPFVAESAGRLHAPKIEYNLVDHCNLSCRECSHLSPFLRAHSLPLGTFTRDINRLAEVYRVQRFRFVGGEPLLNKEICAFVRAARASGIAREIQVVSNGTLLNAISDELLTLIDSIALSLYPRFKPTDEQLRAIRERCERAGVRLAVEHIDRFRKTQTATPIEDEQLVGDLYRSCLIAHTWSCQTFYDGRFYLCSRPIYTDTYLRSTGSAPRDLRAADGVALHEPRLLERLRTYLQSTQPLKSCTFCLGTAGRYERHAQLPAKARWHPQPDTEPAIAKIDHARLRTLMRWQSWSAGVLKRLPSRRLSRVISAAQTVLAGD